MCLEVMQRQTEAQGAIHGCVPCGRGRMGVHRYDLCAMPYVCSRTFYDVLEVPRSADDAQIKRAFKKLAMQFHPDRNPGGSCGAPTKIFVYSRFHQMQRAYVNE